MLENSEELARSSDEYSSLINDFSNNIKSMKDHADEEPDAKKSRVKALRVEKLGRSSIPNLYRLLKKNADKITRFGNSTYPSLPYDSTSASFPTAPKLTEAFHKNKQQLADLAGTEFVYESGKKMPNPCIVTHDLGVTETNHIQSRNPKEGMSTLKFDGITGKGLDICSAPNCADCIDCTRHQAELLKAVRGAISPDPSAGNGLRAMHFKNIVSTLNSWAEHHDKQGGDAVTCNSPFYSGPKGCNHEHQLMATGLRKLARSFSDALSASGVPHRDSIHGDNEEEY